jgi:hypothetical protein
VCTRVQLKQMELELRNQPQPHRQRFSTKVNAMRQELDKLRRDLVSACVCVSARACVFVFMCMLTFWLCD